MPQRLPSSEADLEAWAVYADDLQTRGDPLGEAMALELRVPPQPGPRDRARFQQAMARWTLSHNQRLVVGWCLGHAREVVVQLTERSNFRDSALDPARLRSLLERLNMLLESPRGQLIESLAIDLARLPGRPHRDMMQRAMEALPPNCEQLEVAIQEPRDLAELVSWLPPSVRQLAVSDRSVLAGTDFGPRVLFVHPSRTLDWTQLVSAQMGCQYGGFRYGRWPKAEFFLRFAPPVWTQAMSAALVDPRTGAGTWIPPWSLIERSKRYGLIDARSQVYRTLPEWWYGERAADFAAVRIGERRLLERDPSGDWFIRPFDAEWNEGDLIGASLNGTRLPPNKRARLNPGDAIAFHTRNRAEVKCVFLTQGVEDWYRQRFGPSSGRDR